MRSQDILDPLGEQIGLQLQQEVTVEERVHGWQCPQCTLPKVRLAGMAIYDGYPVFSLNGRSY